MNQDVVKNLQETRVSISMMSNIHKSAAERNISGMSDMYTMADTYGMTDVTKFMQNVQEKIEETINIPPFKQNGGANKTATTRKCSD